MRFIVLSLLFFALVAEAADPVTSVSNSAGKLNVAKVEEFISWAAPFIKQYPPRFQDEAHQKQVVDVTRHVVSELDSVDFSSVKDQKLITNAAFIYAMAHNVDLGTAPKAKNTFEKAVALNPNDRSANYLFGMFLASTQAFHFESLPYLEKAYVLGEKDAQFTIGLLLVEKGDKEKGLVILEAYAKEHPESEHTKKVIKRIRDGSLKFKSDG